MNHATTPTFDTLRAVGAALLKYADAFAYASVEYPRWLKLEIEGDAGYWSIGAAEGTWGADLHDADGEHDRSVVTTVSGESTDIDAIAAALFDAMAQDPVCSFCYSQSHTDIRDCPNIDPEQLADAVHPGHACRFDSPDNLDGGRCVLCHRRR